MGGLSCNGNFYPRSPCGERRFPPDTGAQEVKFLSTLSLRRATITGGVGMTTSPFLSTLSLRRATPRFWRQGSAPWISIHALLAESDWERITTTSKNRYFYPRSPCGERQTSLVVIGTNCVFLSTLSLRRATKHFTGAKSHDPDFYPRSPCGERRAEMQPLAPRSRFLSTLSLRRATTFNLGGQDITVISIHALLAESD